MKKLSVLVAFVLIATIGGVYASWTYVNHSLQFDSYSEKSVTMATVESSNSINGAYEFTSNFNGATIDQLKGNDDVGNEYHKAVLVPSYTSGTSLEVSVKFIPSVAAESDIKEYGVTTYLWLSTTAAMQFPVDANGYYDSTATPTDILSFTYDANNYITIHPKGTVLTTEQEAAGNHLVWEEDEDGNFVANIFDNDINNLVTLNNFILETAEINSLFSTQLNKGVIRCTVSNKTPSEFVISGTN